MIETDLNSLSGKIIGACIEVHRALGPGLLESVYVDYLCHELSLQGLAFQREFQVPVHYKGLDVLTNLRADLIVENEIIVEVKAVQEILPIFSAQLMTYLKLTGKELGLLVNFNVKTIKDGIRRIRINHGVD